MSGGRSPMGPLDDMLTPGQIDVNIARQFQRYLRDFILYGNPNDEMDHLQDATWPNYDQAQIFIITADVFVPTADPWSLNDHCEFILEIIKDPSNGF